MQNLNLILNLGPTMEYCKTSKGKPLVDLECGPAQPSLLFYQYHLIIYISGIISKDLEVQLHVISLYW